MYLYVYINGNRNDENCLRAKLWQMEGMEWASVKIIICLEYIILITPLNICGQCSSIGIQSIRVSLSMTAIIPSNGSPFAVRVPSDYHSLSATPHGYLVCQAI